jgi:hypothetical protein
MPKYYRADINAMCAKYYRADINAKRRSKLLTERKIIPRIDHSYNNKNTSSQKFTEEFITSTQTGDFTLKLLGNGAELAGGAQQECLLPQKEMLNLVFVRFKKINLKWSSLRSLTSIFLSAQLVQSIVYAINQYCT